mmetsp:Transcript_8526/g.21054  ORF Transcript_8526/g.21054 Transcript_8526/m.21054 type:complete len:98 (+) Transcript_8526:140-433(+)
MGFSARSWPSSQLRDQRFDRCTRGGRATLPPRRRSQLVQSDPAHDDCCDPPTSGVDASAFLRPMLLISELIFNPPSRLKTRAFGAASPPPCSCPCTN